MDDRDLRHYVRAALKEVASDPEKLYDKFEKAIISQLGLVPVQRRPEKGGSKVGKTPGVLVYEAVADDGGRRVVHFFPDCILLDLFFENRH